MRKKMIDLMIKKYKKFQDIDASNPITQDTGGFIIDIFKNFVDFL